MTSGGTGQPPDCSMPSYGPPSQVARDALVRARRWIGLLLGVFVGGAVYAALGVGELPQVGGVVAAVGALMATLWVSEAIPIPVPALLPVVLFPLCTGGAVSVRQAAERRPLVTGRPGCAWNGTIAVSNPTP